MSPTHTPPESDAVGALPRGAHLADPGPLGLAAFGLTTFVLSCVNAGFVPSAAEPVVFGLALAYGGIGQFAAGLWEFAKGNTFGATAFCSFGAFWVSYWYLTGHTDLKGISEGDLGTGIGLFLLAWGIFTLLMTVAAVRVNAAVLTVFVLLTLTFFLLAIGEFAASDTLQKIGGYAGLLTAIAAWYTALAGVTKFTFGRDLVPVGER